MVDGDILEVGQLLVEWRRNRANVVDIFPGRLKLSGRVPISQDMLGRLPLLGRQLMHVVLLASGRSAAGLVRSCFALQLNLLALSLIFMTQATGDGLALRCCSGLLKGLCDKYLDTRAALLLEGRQADCGLVRGAGIGLVRSRGILRLTGRASLLHAEEAAYRGDSVGCVALDSSVSQSATSGRG